MTIILDVEFTFSKSVPKLDRTITATGDDLPVVSTEANRQDIGGMSNKFTSGLASVQVPETQGVIPRGRECELAVRGDDHIGDKVIVSGEDSFGVTVCVFITGQLPNDDSFVCRDQG